jgi:hypothetical protein
VAVLAPAGARASVPDPRVSKVRVAIPDFEVAGSASPALALQLQDGFVLGLVRAGVQVVDPVDTARGLDSKPELGRCDSSPCLKSIGQILDVKYLVRVKIDVAGNSYKVVGRIFSTEGAAPAALPLANKSKSCDVCTVAEARDVMFRLADALKVHLEEPAPPLTPPPPPAPPPPPPNLKGPLAAALLGTVAMVAGISVIAAMNGCNGTGCSDNRMRGALGGGLIGAGAVVTIGGAYLAVERTRGADATPRTAITVAMRF